MGTVHVVPMHDLVQHTVADLDLTDWEQHAPPGQWLIVRIHDHEPDQSCACTPSTELVPNDHGPDGWLVTHHSLDGREQHE
ncbi:hypothetical protein GCM10009613_61090 [Pseudonocardia kongjuensis]|uniref:Uncharacterized protein n=1 Tax=Pseudonocardia kongjuensis TaxID=102227 RepID=A0ABN1Y9Z3_9PSEU